MKYEAKTPIKSETSSSSPIPDRAYARANSIFGSATRSHASPISENRYNTSDSNIHEKSIDFISDIEEKPEKPPKTHTQSISCASKASRQYSIRELDSVLHFLHDDYNSKSDISNEFTLPVCRDNISDKDSVVYMEPDENSFSERKSRPIEISDRDSLVTMDIYPCTAYCRRCRKDVHTVIDFSDCKINKSFLNIVSSLASCCSMPSWLNRLRVHRCPHCSTIIAKCR